MEFILKSSIHLFWCIQIMVVYDLPASSTMTTSTIKAMTPLKTSKPKTYMYLLIQCCQLDSSNSYYRLSNTQATVLLICSLREVTEKHTPWTKSSSAHHSRRESSHAWCETTCNNKYDRCILIIIIVLFKICNDGQRKFAILYKLSHRL